MSKIVFSFPGGMVKNSIIGAVVSLGCYVLLQFLVAFLVCEELIGESLVYVAVCVAAAVSAFAGCFVGASRTGRGGVLSVSTVVAVFLVLTVAVALCAGETETISSGLPGVGLAMAAGGLGAAFLRGILGNAKGTRLESGRNRRRRR